jgi:methyltransferase-like protein/trans-aconitate methyltransferase
MNDTLEARYNDVLYTGYAQFYTHPGRLAMLARLFGMSPAPPERCRVLDIGCGDGVNLMSIAQSLPNSTCVGIDLSERTIKLGRAIAEEVGLTNVTLAKIDIMDITPEFGTFDYIIAHGVYSWIPDAVRDRLLDVCRQNLAPQGVAYISYNTYPGWHMEAMVRGMMLYGGGETESTEEQIARARATVEFVASGSNGSDAYRLMLADELKHITDKEDHILWHDDLAAINQPFYLHQFVDHVSRNGLQYLADADLHDLLEPELSEDAAETLDRLAGDRIDREQYLDFLNARRFRRSLICHGQIELNAEPDIAQLDSMFVESPAQLLDDGEDSSDMIEAQFQMPWGTTFTTDNDISTALFRYLGEQWPRWVPFTELLDEVSRRLPIGDDNEEVDPGMVHGILFWACLANLARLHAFEPSLTSAAGTEPVASPLARYQARHNMAITNLRHETLETGETFARQLLPLLDGTRDHREILDELKQHIERGNATITNFDEFIEHELQGLANDGLLMA